jgi:hypothetical protein
MMDKSAIHFLGIKWRDEQPLFVYRPQRDVDQEESFNLFDLKEITIEIPFERYCIGNDGPCPYGRVLTAASKKGNKCFVCGQRDFVQYMPLKALNSDQHEILKTQPHFNYINLFGSELIKVGVASKNNKRKRVLEQGAYATMYFTEGDGFTVRQIEDMVSIMLKVTQHVAWTSKFKVINIKPEESEVEKIFKEKFDEITEIVPERFNENLFKAPEIVMNFEKYHLELPSTLGEILSPDIFSPDDVVSGRIVGVYGQVLFIENSIGIYAINTKNLEGFILNISDVSTSQKLIMPAKTIQVQKPEFTVDLF